jgi:DNA-binding beta-propeller fold protein YncE/phospholipase C
MLLPNQWSLRSAGKSIALDNFPVNLALSPDGRFAAILHCGYDAHEIIIVELSTQKIASRARLDESFYGITFSNDGRKIYCSGASDENVHVFSFDHGNVSTLKDIRLRPTDETGVPAGVAVDRNGKTLFVANLWSGRLSKVALKDGTVQDIDLSTNGSAPVLPRAPMQSSDTAAATKRARAAELASQNDLNGVFPYACVLDTKSGRVYVSLWGAATIAVVDLKTGQVMDRWPVGQHPCEMMLSRDGVRLFVANANDNTVTVLDTRTGLATDTLWATLFPNSPRGSTPNSLALSPDEKMLFVANANINAVAVFDVSSIGHGRSLGFIPTGWYPTSVRVTPDGRQLLIVNGKGNTALANPKGPQPVLGLGRRKEEYTGDMYKGTLDIVDLPSSSTFAQQMSAWTADVLKCTPLRPDAVVSATRPLGNPIPDKPGQPCPITHCIYIIKENRTYDQVFGDMKEGNGDPKLCLFPEKVTPNLHKLAREFVLLDNFYADAEVSASGHEWTMGAIATDFVEKTWPINYGHKGTKFPYPAEGLLPVAYPASGYLWDQALAAGVSYRSYGEFVQNGTGPDQPTHTRVKNLEGHFDPLYHSFDLGYSDLKRADRFISDLNEFENKGDMPRLQIVRLGNDHTHGVTLGTRTPAAYVAENDAAVGKVVDAVSHSKFWPTTAIFIIEDDSQNGPDHVDAHRTEALVISPYTKHGAVDSTLYSTTSMLRTMELILGLQPMTQFDAAASPMYNSFQAQPDAAAYVALAAITDLHATNDASAWGGKMKFNFAKEDENDDIKFNEVIWRSVRGADHPMPAPVHAGFVLSRAGSNDNDD